MEVVSKVVQPHITKMMLILPLVSDAQIPGVLIVISLIAQSAQRITLCIVILVYKNVHKE